MRIALAQINPSLGHFASNAEKISKAIADACERRCDLVIFPELALFGYRPSDLLERKSIVQAQLKWVGQIQKKMPPKITAIFGLVTPNPAPRGKPYFNSAIAIKKNGKAKFFHKQLLPTYDVFDEHRHLEPGDVTKNILIFHRKKILVTICEDIWAWDLPGTRNLYRENPLLKIKNQNIDLVVNLSASPFSIDKSNLRQLVCKKTVAKFKCPLVYVNMVGAQDELIFDGGSFALDRKGRMVAQSVQFFEDLNVVDFKNLAGGFRQQKLSTTECLRQALVLGIKDFCQKTGLTQVHLGLSGGIDSAVVACLAVDALGPSKVSAVALPGPFSSDQSLRLAERLAKNIQIEFKVFEITKIYESLIKNLEHCFGELNFGLVHENIQARLRGMILMAFANHRNSLLLTTGNKDEYASGYCTLYGDMCGGLAPIGDLLKQQVYELAKLYNQQSPIIPQEILNRAPTAELRPHQTDQDTLPPYTDLDKAVVHIVQKKLAAKSYVEKWLLQALMKSEFKRWQAPPILRVTEHAFGKGRNFPISHQAIY